VIEVMSLQNEQILLTSPAGSYLGLDVAQINVPIGNFESVVTTNLVATNIVIGDIDIVSNPHYALPINVASIIPTTPSDLALVPNGVGAIIAAVPDGLISGGNSRGQNAIDFQMSRTQPTQVASGARSIIMNGSENTNNGTDSVIGGTANTIFGGTGSIVLGRLNNASGDFASIAIGTLNNIGAGTISGVAIGFSNTVSNSTSIAIGNNINLTSLNAIVISSIPTTGDEENTVKINGDAVNLASNVVRHGIFGFDVVAGHRMAFTGVLENCVAINLRPSHSYFLTVSGIAALVLVQLLPSDPPIASARFYFVTKVNCNATGVVTNTGLNSIDIRRAGAIDTNWRGEFSGSPVDANFPGTSFALGSNAAQLVIRAQSDAGLVLSFNISGTAVSWGSNPPFTSTVVDLP
jgi:hypothetical protein